MAMTAVDICNLALSRVGQKQFIQSLDEASQEAVCCKVAYGPSLGALLEASDWGFARKRQTLAEIVGGARDGWARGFALPVDCVTPRRFFGGLRAGSGFPAVPWGEYLAAGMTIPVGYGEGGVPYEMEVAADGQTRLLLCDLEVASLLYTSSDVSPAVYSQAFIQCLAWMVAAEVALSLPVKRDLHTNASQRAERELLRAKAQNLSTRRDDAAPDSQFITVR